MTPAVVVVVLGVVVVVTGCDVVVVGGAEVVEVTGAEVVAGEALVLVSGVLVPAAAAVVRGCVDGGLGVGLGWVGLVWVDLGCVVAGVLGVTAGNARAVTGGNVIGVGGLDVVGAILGSAASTASIDVIVVPGAPCELDAADVEGVWLKTLRRQRTNGSIVLDVWRGPLAPGCVLFACGTPIPATTTMTPKRMSATAAMRRRRAPRCVCEGPASSAATGNACEPAVSMNGAAHMPSPWGASASPVGVPAGGTPSVQGAPPTGGSGSAIQAPAWEGRGPTDPMPPSLTSGVGSPRLKRRSSCIPNGSGRQPSSSTFPPRVEQAPSEAAHRQFY